MRTLKAILVQISVICSFACIITKVLDWYNPYMDFSGHIWYVQICLYAAVITLALLNQGGNQGANRGDGVSRLVYRPNWSIDCDNPGISR